MKKILFSIFIMISLGIVGCTKVNNGSISDDKNQEVEEVVENKTTINEVDYSKSFNGINGGAVFYNSSKDVYDIYKEDICEERIAPHSTFKIINSLMGLDQGIVMSEASTLGYDGTVYWKEEWNADLTLREAFKESCLWYYEKIMDSLDKEYVQRILDDLEYGNCDISEWDESGHNTFWISGSLEISALEQVKSIAKIFDGKSNFDNGSMELVKDLMLIEDNEMYSVYGKTGSARVKDAWFTGFVENKANEKIYFAVRIDDETQELAGNVAKGIALDIIKELMN